MAERVNIQPLVERIKKEGKEAFGPFIKAEGVKPDSNEAMLIWNQYKPEVYAIGAILVDPVIKDSFKRIDPEKVATQVSLEQPFRNQFSDLAIELAIALNMPLYRRELEILNSDRSSPDMRNYMRLQYLLAEFNALLPNSSFNDFNHFISSGLHTATDVNINLSGQVAEKVGKGNNDRFGIVLPNSYYMSSELSTNNTDLMVSKVRALREGGDTVPEEEKMLYKPFNPELFALTGEGSSERLSYSGMGKFSMLFVEQYYKSYFKYGAELEIDTVTCLARSKVDGESAFRKFWLLTEAVSIAQYRRNK